ncbi:unnamed protein product [Amoebophrya sp. A120]|nr:unnamed protein product [Amoebophrya sp. A120]|eukprot:GSA120T00009528001.1
MLILHLVLEKLHGVVLLHRLRTISTGMAKEVQNSPSLRVGRGLLLARFISVRSPLISDRIQHSSPFLFG